MILAFLIVAGLVMTITTDQAIRQAILDIQVPAVLTLMQCLTRLGETWLLLALSLGLLIWGYCCKQPVLKTTGWVGIGALAISNIVVEGLKRLIGRPRPGMMGSGDFHWGPSLEHGHDSFPSGHANSGLVMAVVLSSLYPRWRGIWYGAAALVAFTRIYLDVHFASDVFVGAILGIIFARVFLWFHKGYQSS